jgi:Concanavalin A-like lectin/glucanases superfamily/Peptidase family M23/Bacterial tandem repeat domain 1
MALTCSWGGYADTNLHFSEFFNSDHTTCVRFMLQYPNAYTGPMLSVKGTGTYLISQGDFLADSPGSKVKLVMKIGTGKVTHAVDLVGDTWHHLAIRRSGTTFQMFLDGKPVGSTLSLPNSGLPSGTLRFGKSSFDAALDGGGCGQFYGILDDAAIFKKALSESKISQLATAHHILGNEQDLHVGYVFGYVPPGGLTPKLARPVTPVPGANIKQVSSDRNNSTDALKLPLSLTSLAHLPFPQGQNWYVIQGYDDPNGSHKGYASFCFDLMLAGKPQSESNGRPFNAASPGTVDFVKEDAASGGATNFVTIKQAQHEFCDYLHLAKDSCQVSVGDSVSFGKYLANVGDTGANRGAYHLHMAVTTLGEGRKNSGGSFVTIPASITNYDTSDDGGSTWKHVLRGVPSKGQWVRRAVDTSGVRYTVAWKPSESSEIQVYGWTYEDFRAKYDDLWTKGWRLELLEIYVVNGQARYTAVWRPSTSAEIQVYGWSYEDYRKKYDELWNQGWRLHILENYVLNNQVRYTAVWRPGTHGEIQVYGWKYDDYRNKYDELWNQGWRLYILNNYIVSGQVRYTAVWTPSTSPEIQVYGWKYDDYRNKYDELWNQGWRLYILNNYVVNSQVLYTAVWRPGSEGEIQVYGWVYDDYRANYDVLWQKGWRLKLLDIYVI